MGVFTGAVRIRILDSVAMNATPQHGMPRVLSAHECATWSAWSRHRVSCEQCQKFSRGHDVNGLLCETGLMLWDEWMLAAGATKRI